MTNGVKYDARVRLIATGGTVTTTSSSLSVTNADEVTLLLSVAANVANFNTNYNYLTNDYVTICSNNVADAAALGYTALRQAQQDDYKTLFDRVVLDLGTSSKTNLDIGYRKKPIGTDGNDPQSRDAGLPDGALSDDLRFASGLAGAEFAGQVERPDLFV